MKKLMSWFLLWPLLVQFAWAEVNTENGNAYFTFSFLEVLGAGDKLVVEGTWNSRSVNLMFSEPWLGKGWGSEYETYLVAMPDNSATIYEIGSGAQTVFEPKNGMENKESVEKIIKAVEGNGKNPLTNSAKDELRKSLKENAEKRRIYAQRYGVKADMPVGTKLESYATGYQEVTRTKDGYERSYNDGRTEVFSLQGELLQIKDKNGYKIDLEYGEEKLKDGRRKAKNVKDSAGKQISFTWYPNGKLKSASSNKGGGDANFKYDDRGNLIEVIDATKKKITFKYDQDNNLVLVTYQDNSTIALKYDPKTKFAVEVKDRDDSTTGYKYETNPKDPNDYSTEVTKKGLGGAPYTNKFHWIRKIRFDGVQYLFMTDDEVGGVKTKTEYHERCGTPVKIERFGKVTSFAYEDQSCLLKKKEAANGQKFELEYDPTWRKISKIKHKDGWIQYEYDQKGNLKNIKDDKGVRITLFYNFKGQIFNMIYIGKNDEGKVDEKNISFEYNANGKPEYIDLKGVGKAHLIYDPNTLEFKDVEPKLDDNPKLFDGVTTAFNVLLDIVRYKGVDLKY